MSQEIDQIKQRLDLVEFIQEYVHLKQSGTNWKGLCPFHHEKSPSFMVSPDKGIWHCFGCDRGGDIFAFVQEMDSVEFGEALRLLAKRAGVTLPEYSARATQQQSRKTTLFQILEIVQQFYAKSLQESPVARVAQAYLTERGITPVMQETFGLGYSMPEWDTLVQHLRAKGISDADMFAAGVTVQKQTGQGQYDRFRGRIMFPLQDVNGTVVGFTARTLDPNEPAGKYINSPQSDVYNKSLMIYGLHLAKHAIKQLNAAIVVEGNIDVITAHQAGFPNVVATSGTAFTDLQIQLLKRYSGNLLLAFDMDKAGIDATRRSIAAALQHDMNVKIIQLPKEYKDPDECIQADPAAFKQAIRQAVHIIDYYFQTVMASLDLSRVEHKKRAVTELLPVLLMLTNSVERAHYVQKLADMVRVDRQVIEQQLTAQARGAQSGMRPGGAQSGMQSGAQFSGQSSVQSSVQSVPRNRYTQLSQQIIALALQLPHQFAYCAQYLEPDFVVDPTSQALYKSMLDYYNNRGQLEIDGFIEEHRDLESLVRTMQLMAEDVFVEYDPAQQQEELIQGIKTLHIEFIHTRLRELEFQMKDAERAQDNKQIDQLLEEFQLLTNKLSELD